MASRPTVLPLIDRNATNIIDWAASPLQYTGYQAGQVVKSSTHNTTGLLGALWNGYLDYGTVRVSDYIAPVTQRWSTTQVAYSLGGNVIGAGATISTWATYFVGGYRIEIDDGLLRIVGASPLIQPGATLPGRIWLYLDYGVISDPGQPIAAVRVELAAAGAAASPGAGELPLVGVDVDALGDVTGNVYDGADPSIGLLYKAGLPQTFRGVVSIDGAATLNSTLVVSGATDLNSTLDVIGATVLSSTLDVVSDTVLGGNVQISGDLDMDGGDISNAALIDATDITCTSVVASNAAVTISGTSTNITAAAVLGTNNSGGSGVRGTADGILPAVWGVNGTGPGVKGNGGNAGPGIEGIPTVAGQPGVLGTGFAGAGSHGAVGVAIDTASYGVHGASAAAATTSGAGVRADGLGDAPALSAVAVDGNAGHFATDTSSPTRSPVVIVPVDSDPSTTQAGAIFPNATRGVFRIHNGLEYQSLHSSPKGRVFGLSAASTSSNASTSGDIGDITITPEQTGTVIITLTGFWKGSTDTTQLTVLLKDITAGATILTTQVMVAPDRDADGQDRTVPFTVRYFYTLPSTASRLFRYRLNVSATTNWYDVFMTVEGVY